MARAARWLGIRAGEGSVVGLVAAVFAAIEAGRGFGEVGASTLVISRFGAASLPWLFIGLGLVGLGVALAYGASLARLRHGPLFAGLLAAIGVLLALERGALAAVDGVVPVLWLTVYAAGTLGLTVAWTLAGSVFDARQARRLFPLCTSAAIAGSFAGTLSAGPLARLLGTETLILVQAGLFAVAAALVVAVVRGAAAQRAATGVNRRSRTSATAELLAGWHYVRRSPLMRLVAVAYVLFAILDFSVSYPFLVSMSTAFPVEADLATALGLLSAAVTATSFVVSLTIANRLFARVGVAGTALALPVVYVAGFGAWLVSYTVTTAICFRFAQQVAQRGLSNAAWSAFYNVVPRERRAQVLAFNDGIPGQVGTALSGILLIAAGSILAPDQVFWIGLATALALAGVVVAVRRRYADSLLRTLRGGLGERMLEGGPGLATLAGDAAAARDLVEALHSPEPQVRRMAAMLLARVGAAEARTALVATLGDADPGVRQAALDALADLGPDRRGPETHDRDGRLPDPVVATLRDPQPAVRAAAVRAVSALDPPGAPVAVGDDGLVRDPSPAVRAAVAVALVRAGEEDRPHELLRALLESGHPDERIRGLGAVATLGGHSPSARLPDLLRDPVPEVRAAAVAALAAVREGESGGEAPVLPALVAALADEALVVRRAAVAALRDRPDATTTLVERLEHGSGREQDAALAALEGRGESEAVRPRILAWAAGQVARATELRRQHAALTAGRDGPPDRSLPFLASLVRRRRDEIEERLLQALAVLGAPEASGLIRRCLRAGDPDTRAQAIEALDSLADRRLRGAVVRLLEDEPGGPVEGRDAVVQRLIDDPDPWIRALALRARADALADDWAAVRRRASEDADPIVTRSLGERLQGGGPAMPEEVRTLDTIDRMLLLRRVPLFEGLAPEDLQRIAATAVERHYEPDEALVREGDVGDELVVIVEGSVRVVRAEGGETKLVRRFGPGNHIGELAVLRQRPRAATVVADEPGVRGLVIDGRGLTAVLRERPEAAMAMLATLAERIGTQ